jgi:hypothetical protein
MIGARAMLTTEGTKAIQEFTPTPAELRFVYHYGRETSSKERGSAISWLADHGLRGGAMTAFQYWGERNDEDFISKSLFGPYPPFEVPWKSREEFIARVREIMEIYPQLKEWKSAQP